MTELLKPDRKRFFNRMLLVIGGSALLTFALYVIFTKRTPRYYLIPQEYEGWVTIKFEKKDAPPLPKIDGAFQITIPESGIVETSSPLGFGWARDEHFRLGENGKITIPKSIKPDKAEERKRFIHAYEEVHQPYDRLLNQHTKLDTSLWDGARIVKSEKGSNISPGRKTMIHFYVTREAQPFFYKPEEPLPTLNQYW